MKFHRIMQIPFLGLALFAFGFAGGTIHMWLTGPSVDLSMIGMGAYFVFVCILVGAYASWRVWDLRSENWTRL